MESQQSLNYHRIATAIDYITQHFKDQPDLDEVAEKIHLSPFHFQRLFTDWAGVSPKKFLRYISVTHARSILKDPDMSLADAAWKTGLSGTSRLHDLFITIEGMTPGEYKNGGSNLTLNYSYTGSPFGHMLIASTDRGICHMAFAEDEQKALLELQQQFPRAAYSQKTDLIQQQALHIFTADWNQPERIKLHLKGTPFQLKVWEALLKIPAGGLQTYQSIARSIESPGASRAVGSAIGSNPVAFLIPCHRVIQSSGLFGQYHWGRTRKTLIIGWEGARQEQILQSA